MQNKGFELLTDEALTKMAQEGSEEALEFLIGKYKGLARSKSKKYFIAGGDNEDVIQEGMIGMFKAIRDYNEDYDASFRTFAELCVTRQIISAIKSANRQKHQILNESISLNEEANDEEHFSLFEKVPSTIDADPETLTLMKEVVDYLKSGGDDLFGKTENAVWNQMLKGLDYQEIAKILGKSPKTVDNAIQRIKKKVYTYLGY